MKTVHPIQVEFVTKTGKTYNALGKKTLDFHLFAKVWQYEFVETKSLVETAENGMRKRDGDANSDPIVRNSSKLDVCKGISEQRLKIGNKSNCDCTHMRVVASLILARQYDKQKLETNNKNFGKN